MSFKEKQTIHEYRLQSWEAIQKALAAIASLNFGENDIDGSNVVMYARDIAEIMRMAQEDKGRLLAFEESVITLFDADLGNAFVASLSGKEKDNEEEGIDSLKGKVLYQLYHIGVVLGVVVPAPITYEIEQLEAMMSVENPEYSLPQIIRTCSESIRNEDAKELIRVIAPVFMDAFSEDNVMYTWDGALTFVLWCHLLYARLAYLPDGIQKIVLSDYLYRAIVVGVPVRRAVEEVLYETSTPQNFVLANERLFEYTDSNFEYISLGDAGQQEGVVAEQMLKVMIAEYIDQAGDKMLDEERQKAFIHDLYEDKENVVLYEQWLDETFAIYFHLKNADLIPSNRGHELFADEVYVNEVVKLMSWFGIGDASEDDFVAYFSQERPLVSLNNFINELKATLHLDKEFDANNCLEFTRILHEHGLLPADEELIVFHEEDGTFHWVEEHKEIGEETKKKK